MDVIAWRPTAVVANLRAVRPKASAKRIFTLHKTRRRSDVGP